jgi:hypothetical protein
LGRAVDSGYMRGRRRLYQGLVIAALATVSAATAGSGPKAGGGQRPPVNSTLPSISGAAVEGQSVTADPGRWSGPARSYSFQWQRCDSSGAACSAIAAATRKNYLVVAADVGKTLRVTVVASNKNGSATATSGATAVVTTRIAATTSTSTATTTTSSVPPSNTASPTISGTPQQGQTLTAAPGSWSGTTPLSYAYQWKRCDTAGASCAAISGATNTGYLLTSADVSWTIRVSVTASNSVGFATASSAATAVVASPPTLNGKVLKRINYEYPNATGVDPSQGGWQCADNTSSTGATRGTLTADPSTFDSIAHSGLIVNPPTDPKASFGRSACEVLTGHIAKTGNNIYYALAIRFPTNWSGHDDFTSRTGVAGLVYTSMPAAGFIVQAYTNRLALALAAGKCTLAVGCDYDNSCGGECFGHSNNVKCYPINGTNPYGGIDGCKIIPAGQMTLGVWHHVIIHNYETPHANGVIEAWWKRKGEITWNKTVTMSGMPTLALGTNNFGQTLSAATYDVGVSTTDKFGLQNTDFAKSVSVNHDNDCVTTSFDAAASCFGS